MIHYAVFFKPDPKNRSFPVDEIDGAASLHGEKLTLHGTPEFIEEMKDFFTGSTWDSLVRDSDNPFVSYLRNPYLHARVLVNDGTVGEMAAKFETILNRIPDRTSKVVNRRRISSADVERVRMTKNEY